MIKFEVGGHNYQAGALDIFDQMLIAKRLMPVLKNILTPDILASIVSAQPQGEIATPQEQLQEAAGTLGAAALLPAIADAIYALTDADAKMIVTTALKVTQRENKGGSGYSPLMVSNGAIMFKDVSMPNMLTIAWKVIEGHLGDFFATAR